MEKNDVMVPTNDYVFKRIFGHEGNEEITKGLVSAILKVNIQKVELNENKILEKDLKDDKVGILDIRAKLDNDKTCNVEMQVIQNSDIEKRIMFYWSKLYVSGIHEGEEYYNLNKTIVILIANFELDSIKEIPKYHTKWEIREEEYRKIILTNVLEIHIIELPKLKREVKKSKIDKNKNLTTWLRFILNPEDIGEQDMSENEELKKAKEELDKLKEDEHEQYLAYLRDKHIRDTKATERYGYQKGMGDGLVIGREDGIKEGLEKGSKSKERETIINMYKEKIDVETICKVMNLSKEEVENIINKLE